MKLSLPDAVTVLDEFVRSMGLPSRSAAIRHAIRMLRHAGLRRAYAAAWAEWEVSGEHEAWEAAAGDGASESCSTRH